MIHTKAKVIDDYNEHIEFTENKDGTLSLTFSKIPALVFISYDGVGTTDQLFIHGEWQAQAQRVKIESALREATSFTIESTPAIKLEKINLKQASLLTDYMTKEN